MFPFTLSQEKAEIGALIVFREADFVRLLEDFSCPPASNQPVLLISRAIGGNSGHTCHSDSEQHHSAMTACSTKDWEALSRSFTEVQHAIMELRASVDAEASVVIPVLAAMDDHRVA